MLASGWEIAANNTSCRRRDREGPDQAGRALRIDDLRRQVSGSPRCGAAGSRYRSRASVSLGFIHAGSPPSWDLFWSNFGPGLNIRSGSSSECSALPRCVIAGSKRTPIACSSPAHSPICSWRVGIYCTTKGRNVSEIRRSNREDTAMRHQRGPISPVSSPVSRSLCPYPSFHPLFRHSLAGLGSSAGNGQKRSKNQYSSLRKT